MAAPLYADKKVPTPQNPGPHFQGAAAAPGSTFAVSPKPQPKPAAPGGINAFPSGADRPDFRSVMQASSAPKPASPGNGGASQQGAAPKMPPEIAQGAPASGAVAQPAPKPQGLSQPFGSFGAKAAMQGAPINTGALRQPFGMVAKPMYQQTPPPPPPPPQDAQATGGTPDHPMVILDPNSQAYEDAKESATAPKPFVPLDPEAETATDAYIKQLEEKAQEINTLSGAPTEEALKARQELMEFKSKIAEDAFNANLENARNSEDRYVTPDTISTTPEKLTGESPQFIDEKAIEKGYNDLATNIAEREAAVNATYDKTQFQAKQDAMRRNAGMGRSSSGIGEASLQGLDAEMATARAKEISQVHKEAFDQERQRLNDLAALADQSNDRTVQSQIAFEQAWTNRLELAMNQSEAEYAKVQATKTNFQNTLTGLLGQLYDEGKVDDDGEAALALAYQQFAAAANAQPPLTPDQLDQMADTIIADFAATIEPESQLYD
ncbi:MAG: hypothetical protein WC789_10665 [Lentisphaeria bacterium]